MDATTPMFMLKRTGRAAEFAALEEAAAAGVVFELAGAVADVAEVICVPLMVVPKPGVDIGVATTAGLDRETLLVVETTLCVEAEAVVAVVVPVTVAPIVKGGDSVRTC